jgi:hypothetical protein
MLEVATQCTSLVSVLLASYVGSLGTSLNAIQNKGKQVAIVLFVLINMTIVLVHLGSSAKPAWALGRKLLAKVTARFKADEVTSHHYHYLSRHDDLLCVLQLPNCISSEVELDVLPTVTVAAMIEILAQKSGLEPDTVQLSYDGQVLNPDQILRDCVKQSGERLQLTHTASSSAIELHANPVAGDTLDSSGDRHQPQPDVAFASLRAESATIYALIAEKDATIAEKDTTIAENNAAIAENNATIAENNATIAEKDATIAEKDVTIAENNATIAEKDAAIAEKDATIAKNDAAMAEKDVTIAQKDAVITATNQRKESNLGRVHADDKSNCNNEGSPIFTI